jgi:DNA-binding CsgD family transcriptional regulator
MACHNDITATLGLELAARARVRTHTGTCCSCTARGSAAIPLAVPRSSSIPPRPQDVVPVVALSYGLTYRESQVTMQCIQGRATKEIARLLSMSPYTLQDHVKSIFEKTGLRNRGELVGQIFLNHYAIRWEAPDPTPPGLLVRTMNTSRS